MYNTWAHACPTSRHYAIGVPPSASHIFQFLTHFFFVKTQGCSRDKLRITNWNLCGLDLHRWH